MPLMGRRMHSCDAFDFFERNTLPMLPSARAIQELNPPIVTSLVNEPTSYLLTTVSNMRPVTASPTARIWGGVSIGAAK